MEQHVWLLPTMQALVVPKETETPFLHLDFRGLQIGRTWRQISWFQNKFCGFKTLDWKKEHFNLFDTAAVRFISGHHLALIFHLRKISCWQLLDYDRLSYLEIFRFRNISQFDLNRLSDLLLNLSTRERPNVDGLWTWKN